MLFLRLRQHFSQEDVQLYSFPLPCSPKLSQSYIQQLIGAESYDAALELVKSGPMARCFAPPSLPGWKPISISCSIVLIVGSFELLGRQSILCVPGLKEIELRNIISIIECIATGPRPSDILR